jgi:adenosine deaminase
MIQNLENSECEHAQTIAREIEIFQMELLTHGVQACRLPEIRLGGMKNIWELRTMKMNAIASTFTESSI